VETWLVTGIIGNYRGGCYGWNLDHSYECAASDSMHNVPAHRRHRARARRQYEQVVPADARYQRELWERHVVYNGGKDPQAALLRFRDSTRRAPDCRRWRIQLRRPDMAARSRDL